VEGHARTDLPVVDASTEPFWSAARVGRLMFVRCVRCAHPFLYPRRFCPRCWGEEIVWEEASGRARLYTYSQVMRNDLPPFAGRVPYIAAVVELREGPRLMTNIVDCDPGQLRCDMDLEVVFRRETDEITLPVFRPS
jgi:uncharacterized OB-fold protein